MAPDIHEDSRNRLPLIRREDLPEQDREVFDAAANNPRSLVGLRGPGGIRLYSPTLSRLSRPAQEYLRFNSGLESRLSELAILVTARSFDSQFEWSAHEPAALRAGLDPVVVDVVKHRKALDGVGEKEAAIIQLGREVFGEHRVSSATFARALELFGREILVNMVALMGAYSATAILLATFDQQLAPGQEPLLTED